MRQQDPWPPALPAHWRPILADLHLMLLNESGKLHTPEPKNRKARQRARREHAGIWVAIRIVGHLMKRIDQRWYGDERE